MRSRLSASRDCPVRVALVWVLLQHHWSLHTSLCAVVSFTYSFSPIMFRIEQYRKGLLQFLTSVCAIVGGVFTVRRASLDGNRVHLLTSGIDSTDHGHDGLDGVRCAQ